MAERTNRVIYLRQNPVGIPEESDFELVEETAPSPGAGQVLVQNRFVSVDPYMRGRIGAGPTYADNWKPGEPMRDGCVGEVVESNADRFRVGDHVVGGQGWRDWFVADAGEVRKVDDDAAPLSAYLGALGMLGMTAFVGFEKLAEPQAGQTVFVSGAAGDGIDIYFDNVGGDHLEAALESMNQHGTIISCGMISVYNATEPPAAPRNLFKIVGSRLTIRGFIVGDHWEHYDEFVRVVAPKVGSGEIPFEETVVDGLAAAPRAFIGLFHGENLGKMVVRID